MISEHHPVWGFSPVFQGIRGCSNQGLAGERGTPASVHRRRNLMQEASSRVMGELSSQAGHCETIHGLATAGSLFHLQEEGESVGPSREN